MAYRFFTVPIQDPRQAKAELNAFLRSHRVLIGGTQVDRGGHELVLDVLCGLPGVGGVGGGSNGWVEFAPRAGWTTATA